MGSYRPERRSLHRQPTGLSRASRSTRQRESVRRLLAIHGFSLSALPALQAGPRCRGRIQRKVHGWSVGAERRQLRHTSRPLPAELPQLLLSASTLAVHRRPSRERRIMASEGLSLVEMDEYGVNTAFRADVLAGLAQKQKAVPARWLYDDEGSRLFEAITRLPEYYPTRAEIEILENKGHHFRRLIEPG